MRALWPKSRTPDEEKDGDKPLSSLLEMVQGMGGDALAGLNESEEENISTDLRMLLDFARSPANDARRRAATAPERDEHSFLLMSTSGFPNWSEKEERDAYGRITGLSDALGNRTRITYDQNGFVRADADPVGPLNTRLGDRGGLIQRNPQRGLFGERAVFDDASFPYRTRLGARLDTSPLSNVTQSQVNTTGGRSFTTYDLMGRPMYTYDSKGRLSFTRYSPWGQAVGTYNDKGQFTLYGHDTQGRRNFAVDARGNRILMDHDRDGHTVIRTADGKTTAIGSARGLPPWLAPASGATTPKSNADHAKKKDSKKQPDEKKKTDKNQEEPEAPPPDAPSNLPPGKSP